MHPELCLPSEVAGHLGEREREWGDMGRIGRYGEIWGGLGRSAEGRGSSGWALQSFGPSRIQHFVCLGEREK